MINKTYFLLVALMFCNICYAQQAIVFNDDFETFDNNWEFVNTKEFKVEQKQGKLFISKATQNRISNGCMWYKKTILSFFADQDFTINFDAKSISSEFPNSCFDFTWGRMQEFDGIRKNLIYQLNFDLNKVRLAKFQLGKGWEYYDWSNVLVNSSVSNFSIERGVFNHFEIIQKDKVLTVKVNGLTVYQIPIEPQVGSEIGFQQCLKSEWELDNIVIKQ